MLTPHQHTVLCIGDLMLDEFVYGDVARISPEASTPVITVTHNEVKICGACDDAQITTKLGSHCILIGLIGEDQAGQTILHEVFSNTMIQPRIIIDDTRPTTHRVRFVSDRFKTHLLRVEWENEEPASAEVEAKIIAAITSEIPFADVVLLVDYRKGVLTPNVVQHVTNLAREAGKPLTATNMERC